MAKQKVYAVRKGKKTGVFTSWDECSASVSGFPGAEYKGFLTKEEAEASIQSLDHYRRLLLSSGGGA